MAGVALFVGPTAKPPDMACFEGLYRTCEELGAAVWVHPCRPQSYADYDAYKVRTSKIVVCLCTSSRFIAMWSFVFPYFVVCFMFEGGAVRQGHYGILIRSRRAHAMTRNNTICHFILHQGEGSKHQIWNTFGWIYDTSVAMVHIALAGVFRRYPGALWGVFFLENV